jgi:hypothetical protein
VRYWACFASHILYAKVINNQTEYNGTRSMGEETGCMQFGETLDESIISKLAGMGKTVNASADLDENVSVVDEVLKLVLLHAGRNDFDGDSHVLVLVHGSVEVFDVDHHEGIRIEQAAVEEDDIVFISAVGVLKFRKY